MNRVLPAVFALAALAASLVVQARSTPHGAGFSVYGATADGLSGHDYVALPPLQVIASLASPLIAGAFIGADYTKEYALALSVDQSQTLVTVDTASGAVSLVGEITIGQGPLASIGADSDGALFGLESDAACTQTLLIAIDKVTGMGTLIGPVGGCLQSIVFDSNDAMYLIDRDADAVEVIDSGGSTKLGPLGVATDVTSTLAFAPGSDALTLFQFDQDAGTTMTYSVDTTTGAATPIGSLGGDAPIAALALAPPRPPPPDGIFDNGFD